MMIKKELDKLVFIDESGVDTAMTRYYARSLKGKRAYGEKPIRASHRKTLIAGLSYNSILAPFSFQGNMNGDIFLFYVKEILIPELKPGQIVVLDNLSAHKVNGVEESILSAGVDLIYLPPYSPDFSPIEHCWSKIKAFLRSKAARTLKELNKFIKKAFNLITQKNILGWFSNCGYVIHSNG